MDAMTFAALQTHKLRDSQLAREAALRAAHAERGLVSPRDARRARSALASRPHGAAAGPAAAAPECAPTGFALAGPTA